MEETVKREVYEQTGVELGKMDLYDIYSEPDKDKIVSNGDQALLYKFFL
ncbi:hypothetical protein GCM10010954_22770 [Halobacillus andaensis]|uniref:Nudix hydrolase domain-containing protein n=1 Tax=Halobacillus andaensis TaxID=1176239 RepID=A0A917EVS1_HALAA|nr:hypothetical protein [Halobacillus andaensis]MBP2006133.1 ADP-ribose pyrophosphatase YjhB (NUDIX family) [Halobacillus andaensis]GGF23400.1 hypothetical protein GCM10010954_22770 [Halobacillus andaensis]